MIETQRRFLVLVLIAITVPLFADSPEYPVGGTAVSLAPLFRGGAAAATDGTDFFVVWADGRTPGRGAIMATRVKRTGEVLDRFGIRLTSVPAATSSPAVIWDGDAYLVLWTQGPYYEQSLQRDEVWATRVDRDGRVLTTPRLISEEGSTATTTSGVYAATNGNVTVIAYRHHFVNGAVRIAVLDRAGNVIRRETLPNPSLDLSRGISVAATSTNFVVTWATNDGKLFAASLGSDGRVVRKSTQIGVGEDPVVATDGTSVTMLWRRWMPDVARWVLNARTADAGLAQIGGEQTLGSEQIIEWPSLLWRGDRYEVIAGQQSYTETRQNPYGLLSIEFGRGVPFMSRRRGDELFNAVVPQPVAVTNGSEVLVAYRHPSNHSTQIMARVYRGSSPEPEVQQLLSWSAANAHMRPAIVSSASGHMAAWIENVSVYATRIDANGNSLDGRGVTITPSGFAVRLAFDGTNYVLAWLEGDRIGIRWIAPATGATVTEVHVPLQARPYGFGLAVLPDTVYLAWVDDRVRVTQVRRETRTHHAPLAVSPEGMTVANAALGWNGSMLLVAWNEIGIAPGVLPITRAVNVQAARVASDFSTLDPALMVVATPGVISLGAPSIASNGEDWLVVTDIDDQDILARRVLRSGNVEGAEASKIGDGAAPAVTWDGTRYAIAYKSGESEQLPDHPLMLGAVPATGALPMMGRKLIMTHVVSPPSIARTATGEVAVVYTKVSILPEHASVERSYFRVMDFTPTQRGRNVGH